MAVERAERGEMSLTARQSGEEASFGIRAIEKGYEVEGVWNSRTTTPLQSPVTSSPPSPGLRGHSKLKKIQRNSSLSNLSQLEIPEAALVNGDFSDTDTNKWHGSVRSAMKMIRQRTAEDSPEAEEEISMRGRPAYQPFRGSSIKRQAVHSALEGDIARLHSKRLRTSLGKHPELSRL